LEVRSIDQREGEKRDQEKKIEIVVVAAVGLPIKKKKEEAGGNSCARAKAHTPAIEA